MVENNLAFVVDKLNCNNGKGSNRGTVSTNLQQNCKALRPSSYPLDFQTLCAQYFQKYLYKVFPEYFYSISKRIFQNISKSDSQTMPRSISSCILKNTSTSISRIFWGSSKNCTEAADSFVCVLAARWRLFSTFPFLPAQAFFLTWLIQAKKIRMGI